MGMLMYLYAWPPDRSINNKLGPRKTLLIGTMGYALFVGSFL